MVTAIADESGEVLVVQRTIIVTPEQPGSTAPTAPAAITSAPIRLQVKTRAATWNLSQSADTTQHQYGNAVTISPDVNGTFTYLSPNIAFTANEAQPPGVDSVQGYRSAWWKYTCYADATMTLVAAANTAAIALTVYEIDAEGNWALLSGGQSLTVNQTVPMTYGNTYYLRVASTTDVLQSYNLSGTVTIRIIPGVILTPPVRVSLAARAGHLFQPHIDAVPVKVRLSLHALSLKVYNAPPIKVVVGLSAATTDTSMVLSSPTPGEVVGVNPPEFMVGMVSSDDPDAVYTIEMQYDSVRTFNGSPVTLVEDVEVADGGVIFSPTAQVPVTTWWRARLLKSGEQIIAWSIPRSFTINTVTDISELTVSYTVDATQDRSIHLWYLDPDGVEVGDEVTAYGMGFPSSGNIVVGLNSAVIVSWQLIPANPAAAAEPTIDNDIVTPEHYEVVFQVPEIEEPGGTLTVEA